MKMTKIICSIGPASYNYDVFLAMAKEGMNCARINFSHAALKERNIVEDLVKRINKEENLNIAVLYDTKGPDIRTGNMESEGLEVQAGETIKIVKEKILGTKDAINLNHPEIIDVVDVGQTILLDNGLIRFVVVSKDRDSLSCSILDTANLKSYCSVNIPGVSLNIPFISKEDEEDIKYACENKGDFIAISFVSKAEDVLETRKLLEKYGHPEMKIITKIETASAVNQIDEILDLSDGVMIARGDLGVEMPMSQLPIIQKDILKKAELLNKICIVATEMLASMYTSPRPTRAELTDVANAVFDGADSVMLSGETTIGRFPVESVKFMSDICLNAEANLDFNLSFVDENNSSISDMITCSAISSAKNLKAKVIVTPTMSGYTARAVSELKPKCPILALCPNEKVARGLALSYGVYPKIIDVYKTTDDLIKICIEEAQKFIPMEKGDKLIITGGFPTGSKKNTNFLKIEEV